MRDREIQNEIKEKVDYFFENKLSDEETNRLNQQYAENPNDNATLSIESQFSVFIKGNYKRQTPSQELVDTIQKMYK